MAVSSSDVSSGARRDPCLSVVPVSLRERAAHDDASQSLGSGAISHAFDSSRPFLSISRLGGR
eukprot:6196140-Pleurochrysis_carterae.AAC.3